MTFTFTEEEINTIFNALANMPWKQVVQLQKNIQRQYNAQNNKVEEPVIEDKE